MLFIKTALLAFNPLFILFAVLFSTPAHGQMFNGPMTEELQRTILQEICNKAYPKATQTLLKAYEIGGVNEFWRTEREMRDSIVKDFEEKAVNKTDRYYGTRLGLGILDDVVNDIEENLILSRTTRNEQERMNHYRRTCIMHYELF